MFGIDGDVIDSFYRRGKLEPAVAVNGANKEKGNQEDLVMLETSGDRIDYDKAGWSDCFRNFADICESIAPLVPVYQAFKKGVLSVKDEDLGDRQICDRLNRFLRRFGFKYTLFKMYEIREADASKLSQDAEAYYNLLDASHKTRFYDLLEKEVEDSSGQKQLTYEYVEDSVKCSWEFSQLLNMKNGRGFEAEVTFSVPTSHRLEMTIYKDSTISAVSLMKYLNAFEITLVTLQTFMQTLDEDNIHIKVTYGGGVRSYVEDSVKSYILVRYNYYDVMLHPRFNVVGTQSELEALRECLKTLHIRMNESQEIVVDDDAVAQQQSNVVMNRLTASVLGSDATSKNYGCLMYLSWLVFSDFYMDTWRGFLGMKDWVHFAGQDNVADIVNKVDVYATVDTGISTLLITSGGFLNITEGTVENPERVEFLDMDSVYTLCGIGETSDKFSESAFAEFEQESSWNKTVVDLGYVDALTALNFVYKDSYFQNAVNDYEEGWLELFKHHCEAERQLGHLDFSYERKFYNATESLKSEYIDSEGLNLDFAETLRKKLNTALFSGSGYGAGTERNRREVGFNGKEIRVMRKIIHTLYSLFNDDALTVKICETPVGRKNSAPVLWSLADVKKSEHCVRLPKVKKEEYEEWRKEVAAIREKYSEECLKAEEEHRKKYGY